MPRKTPEPQAVVRFHDGEYRVAATTQSTATERREAKEVAEQLNSNRDRSIERRAHHQEDA